MSYQRRENYILDDENHKDDDTIKENLINEILSLMRENKMLREELLREELLREAKKRAIQALLNGYSYDLAYFDIYCIKDFRIWSLKNHPDKGGDLENYKKISNLVDIYLKIWS